MAFTTDTANKILDQIFSNTAGGWPSSVYVSLHTGDPGNSGASEVTGGSYARLLASFAAADAKHTQNSADLEFTSMPATTVTHVGIWSAVSGGTFWWGAALTTPKTIGSGDTLKIAVGDLDITLT